jgi:transketolase
MSTNGKRENKVSTEPRDLASLERIARDLRRDVVTMVYRAGDGHIGTSLSIADIVAALYFDVMNVRPEEPRWPERDRLVLSKGHACPIVYAALARRGFFPLEELPTLRGINSRLQGHPDTVKTPGIDATAGPLGTGIAVACGMALAARLTGRAYYTYVIAGDGELNEGLNWEAIMTAFRYRLGRLIVFVDNNGFQSGGTISQVSEVEPILPKFEAFGWSGEEIDGHDMGAVLSSIKRAKRDASRPSVIVARTLKAKGVDFMEGTNDWHKRVPTDEEYRRAVRCLEGVVA